MLQIEINPREKDRFVLICNRRRAKLGLDVTDLDSVELPVLSSRSVTRRTDFGSYLLQIEIVLAALPVCLIL